MITRSNMGNVPSQYAANADRTVSIVNEIFAAFPGRFRFTSGYRSPAQNAAANGVAKSYHLTAQAADFVPINGSYPAGEKEAIASLIAKHGYEVIKHDVGSGLHYHIEPAPGGVAALPGATDLLAGVPPWLIAMAVVAGVLLIFGDD